MRRRGKTLLTRGTMRNPGADLSRLPVGLDLSAISVAEGVRAALACGIVILANEWIGWPPLVYAALGANLACFADVGGPIRPRLAALLAFSFLGALTWSAFGLLRPLGLAAVVPVAAAVIFCNSFARVWGPPAMAVGNLLTVVLVLGLDRALAWPEALLVAAMFAAGGLWATFLTLVIWRLHPYRPAREAVGESWRLLAELAGDLRHLAGRAGPRTAPDAADWDAHARAHRRAVRESIEQARGLVMELVHMRGTLSQRGSQALMRLEAGDQLFGALIALSDLLQDAPAPRRAAIHRLLRILQPFLLALSRSIVADARMEERRAERAIGAMLASARGDRALGQAAEDMADRLRIAIRLATPAGAGGREADGAEASAGARILGPVQANLDWSSAMLRHALRTSLVAAAALLLTLSWEGGFTRWLTITVVLTMQPFFATTWQRVLERIAGTVLGGFVGAGLALIASTPLALAALLFPLCVLGFSARQVSYGAFVACLTPQLVVLVELLDPGYSSWHIAEMRALFTVMGGAVAVAGTLLLWPSWEPYRLRREASAAIAAHGRYAEAVVAEALGEASAAAAERSRRAAGVASNNLEASLARALQEPGRGQRARLEAASLAASILRRMAGPLSTLHHAGRQRRGLDLPAWSAWRDWIAAAFAALEDGEPLTALRPEPVPPDPLARLVHQLELLDGAVRRFW
ncbi:MAG TPA: FUSC family protein [Dongiaceae bacterium]|nr:FUSC family protein [Dongiaceae bacterium]